MSPSREHKPRTWPTPDRDAEHSRRGEGTWKRQRARERCTDRNTECGVECPRSQRSAGAGKWHVGPGGTAPCLPQPGSQRVRNGAGKCLAAVRGGVKRYASKCGLEQRRHFACVTASSSGSRGWVLHHSRPSAATCGPHGRPWAARPSLVYDPKASARPPGFVRHGTRAGARAVTHTRAV